MAARLPEGTGRRLGGGAAWHHVPYSHPLQGAPVIRTAHGLRRDTA